MIWVLGAAYFIGSIPFAMMLARRWGSADLRRLGSGNVGATNVLRAYGVTPGVIVAVLDMAKGAASVWLAGQFGAAGASTAYAGLAAIVGHVFPVWTGFRGGKGVATACGVFSVLAPPAALTAFGAFIVTVWVSRYVSLGSLVASLTLPPAVYATGSAPPAIAAACAAAALIVVRHRTNVMRLLTGTERRVGYRERLS
jgi:glycerol-3-phosphate acyltransferase PlsY